MTTVKTPRSLRRIGNQIIATAQNGVATKRALSAAFIVAAGSTGTAEAQQQPASALPPVTVDPPVARQRPVAARPSPAQRNARAAIRRTARQAAPVQATPVPAASAGSVPLFAQLPDGNPYADPAAPYKADRLSSAKFSEPILNTPRSITVLTKELLDDKNATTIRDIARTTAGVTLGTGEGGNAFGDRFFIRGFDARNDVFVDGVRDPGVSIRENFFTEQVEILRGPASSFAGRGTAGGAVNIVTKQAGNKDFVKIEGTAGTDPLGRVTVDVNRVISPVLSLRINGLYQKAEVPGRNYVFDDRWGIGGAVKFTPTDNLTFTANYYHVDLDGMADFGVPYNATLRKPFTELGVPRETFYGFKNRDFQKSQQDIGTLTGEYRVNDYLTLSNKTRFERSVLDYIGTLPQGPNLTTLTINASPQSRYQPTDTVANQTEVTLKFQTGPVKHTVLAGVELSRQDTSIDNYSGLASELFTGGTNGSGTLANVSIYNPLNNNITFATPPRRSGTPTNVLIDSKSAYLIETANYNDFIILNGGLRFDDYNVTSQRGASTISAHSQLTDWNAGIVVKPLPYASIYAAYATSSNPVGAEVDGTSVAYGGFSPTSTTNQVFGPERNKSYEIGTKWELFDRRLLATAALFRTDKDNARESIPAGLPNAGGISDGAKYHVQGIDIGIAGKITEKWSIYGGLVLMDSNVDRSLSAVSVGQKLANVAHQSLNILTKYKVTNWFELGGQATYASKIYGGTLAANVPYSVLPDHWRFDAFAEIKVNDTFKIKASVNNILDKRYYDAFYRSAAPFAFIAPGRSGQLTLTAKF